MPETPEETARRRAREQRSFTGAGAADIARQQENALRQGFRRGIEPAPPVRQIGPRPEAPAAAPLAPAGLSKGVISSEEKERRRREKIARGERLEQEDL